MFKDWKKFTVNLKFNKYYSFNCLQQGNTDEGEVVKVGPTSSPQFSTLLGSEKHEEVNIIL